MISLMILLSFEFFENKKYMKMTKDAILNGSSQQAFKDAVNRRKSRTRTLEVLPISVLNIRVALGKCQKWKTKRYLSL